MLLIGNDESADRLRNQSNGIVGIVGVGHLIDILELWVLHQLLLDAFIVLTFPLHFLSSLHDFLLEHVGGETESAESQLRSCNHNQD